MNEQPIQKAKAQKPDINKARVPKGRLHIKFRGPRQRHAMLGLVRGVFAGIELDLHFCAPKKSAWQPASG